MMQNMHSSQNYTTQNCNMNSCQHHSMNCNFNGNSGCNSNSGCNFGRNSNSACNNNRNQNCNCYMNQQNLKCYIDFVSFAALDCAMFLDTHPKNAEGLEYFEYYTNARKQALKEYSFTSVQHWD